MAVDSTSSPTPELAAEPVMGSSEWAAAVSAAVGHPPEDAPAWVGAGGVFAAPMKTESKAEHVTRLERRMEGRGRDLSGLPERPERNTPIRAVDFSGLQDTTADIWSQTPNTTPADWPPRFDTWDRYEALERQPLLGNDSDDDMAVCEQTQMTGTLC